MGVRMKKSSKQFYTELSAEGLAKRKEKIHTRTELAYLKKILNKKGKILDLACGYGRFTFPLKKQGYEIEGLDITPVLLNKAKKDAKEKKLKIRFKLGDMKKLPYKKESFDNIICMWSAFLELSTLSDQKKAVKEMLRVLKKDGFAFLEMNGLKGNGKRVGTMYIDGIESYTYHRQNKKTLTKLMKDLKIKKFKVWYDDFGGRERLLLMFWKEVLK